MLSSASLNLPAARADIEAMLVEWAWLIDHGRAHEAIAFFTPEAEQTIQGDTAKGIAAIGERLRRRAAMQQRTSRHVIGNLRLLPESDTSVRGSWILTLYRTDGAADSAVPHMVCDVEDTYTLTAEQVWKIASRRVVPVFAAAP
jgi:hypothetical protein